MSQPGVSKPTISQRDKVLIKPNGKHNGNNAWILMVNTGGSTAKHVRLMVSAAEKIIRYDNFSAENMTPQDYRGADRTMYYDGRLSGSHRYCHRY